MSLPSLCVGLIPASRRRGGLWRMIVRTHSDDEFVPFWARSWFVRLAALATLGLLTLLIT